MLLSGDFSVRAGTYVLSMGTGRWTPIRQGDIGEMSAMSWLAGQGATVFIPVGHSPNCDLIAEFEDRVERVQVKTSISWHKQRYVVALCTRRGNRSWNGVVKRLDAPRCDKLFVHVGDGRRWYIPAAALGGGSGIVLGGPKYAEHEIEPGEPLPQRLPSLDSAPSWRDTRAVKGTAL
jgi:PD-(D/E)XK endonuclease